MKRREQGEVGEIGGRGGGRGGSGVRSRLGLLQVVSMSHSGVTC